MAQHKESSEELGRFLARDLTLIDLRDSIPPVHPPIEISVFHSIILSHLFLMSRGFLGSRATLMLDVVVTAMAVVIPIMVFNILLARRRQYAAHKLAMTLLSTVLLITVIAFEVDIRFFHPWREGAESSPYYADPWYSSTVGIALIIHLFFAISTIVLWTVVVVRALRRFPRPPHPAKHSASHKFWARLAAIDMTMTAITGWIFYYLAFVAT